MDKITVTGFRWAPPFAQGLVRDLRVRWALEEAGLPYEVRLIDIEDLNTYACRQKQPFGMVPAFEADGRGLFESGAIVHRIAADSEALMPANRQERADTVTWMFAALNTVEPPILDLQTTKFLEGDKPWYEQRLPVVRDRIRNRLGELSSRLGHADWLDGAFSAGDLMMVAVLLRLKPSGMLDEYPNLSAYVARGEARPAYKRAFDAQLRVFTGMPPTC
jgi:glutathione S-transferase